MFSYSCTNADCPQHDVPKDSPVQFGPGEVSCGSCGQPCSDLWEGVTDPRDRAALHPDPPAT